MQIIIQTQNDVQTVSGILNILNDILNTESITIEVITKVANYIQAINSNLATFVTSPNVVKLIPTTFIPA